MKITIRLLTLLGVCTLFLGLYGLNGLSAAQNVSGTNSAAGQEKNVRPRSTTGTQLATSELVRIELEAQDLNQRLADLGPDAAGSERADRIVSRLPPLTSRAEQICTQDEAERQRFYEEVTALVYEAREFASHRPGPWVAHPETWQAFCQDPTYPMTVVQEMNAQLSAMVGAAAARQAIEEKLKTLTERREEVLREMSDDLAGNSVAEKIPLLLLIIFGVGAGTLAGVKLFQDDVQKELVSSGQIVQFVTILILLGVILSLGLAQRLQAETLGTLLGGLAGYVLSQGVGRQAQQQVLNEMKSVAANPPPPPPPPPQA